MKRIVIGAVLSLYSLAGAAAGGELQLLDAGPDVENKPSLQRGARLFVNYCLSCHSIEFMRYNRVARDLGIPEELMEEEMVFAGERIESKMEVAMRAEDGARWFGVPPPDLSVIARSRGPDWLYSYLVTFYDDTAPARPFGVNNVVFEDVGMPNVMWQLQGKQVYVPGEVPDGVESINPVRLEPSGEKIKIFNSATTADGGHVRVVDTLEITEPGAMSPGEFRRSMRDLVNFLTYVGEPAQLERTAVGFWVLVFLAFLFFLTYLLYKEYWKDVH